MNGTGEFGVNENTRPEEAVKIAMDREYKARQFYLKCAAIVSDPGVKKMFEFLAKEEARHFELLEREYDRFIAGEN
ncbi:MAG TPA: ferritin family protein [Thermoanaerobaculaceae bacterium]|nr:ferritin family protein [Thermoanaerobaculaceae bacterium]